MKETTLEKPTALEVYSGIAAHVKAYPFLTKSPLRLVWGDAMSNVFGFPVDPETGDAEYAAWVRALAGSDLSGVSGLPGSKLKLPEEIVGSMGRRGIPVLPVFEMPKKAKLTSTADVVKLLWPMTKTGYTDEGVSRVLIDHDKELAVATSGYVLAEIETGPVGTGTGRMLYDRKEAPVREGETTEVKVYDKGPGRPVEWRYPDYRSVFPTCEMAGFTLDVPALLPVMKWAEKLDRLTDNRVGRIPYVVLGVRGVVRTWYEPELLGDLLELAAKLGHRSLGCSMPLSPGRALRLQAPGLDMLLMPMDPRNLEGEESVARVEFTFEEMKAPDPEK